MASSSPNSSSNTFPAAWKDFCRTADQVLKNASVDSTSKNKNKNKGKGKSNAIITTTKSKRDRRRHKQNNAQRPKVAVASQEQYAVNIQSILQSLSKLLSAVNVSEKRHAGENGALRILVRGCDAILKMKIVDQHQTTTMTTTLMIGVKAIQICVFKNTTARNRCRSEGIFGLLHTIMSKALVVLERNVKGIARDDRAKQLVLLSETLTTLAAVCLGNDLNGLVGSLQFDKRMVRAVAMIQNSTAESTTPGASSNNASCLSRLDQTVTYLRKLFQVIQSEQKQLLDHSFCPVNDNYKDLIERIETSEQLFQTGVALQINRQWSQADAAFGRALHEMEPITSHTNLLDDIKVDLLNRRSAVRLELEDWQGVLDDLQQCKACCSSGVSGNTSPDVQIINMVRQSDAYVGLKRFEDAQEALKLAIQQLDDGVQQQQQQGGHQQKQQLLILGQGDMRKSLTHKWNRLQLAKSKAASRAKPQAKPQPREDKESEESCIEINHEIDAVEAVGSQSSRLDNKNCNSIVRLSRLQQPRDHRHRNRRQRGPIEDDEEECIDASSLAPKPGTYVNCMYGTGIVQEVRKCGTTKIKLKSWSPGKQEPMAYLMPEFYTVLAVSAE